MAKRLTPRWHKKKKKKARTKQNSREMGIDYASSHMCTSNKCVQTAHIVQIVFRDSESERDSTRSDDSQLLVPDKCFACLPIDQKLIIPMRDTKHTALRHCMLNNCENFG